MHDGRDSPPSHCFRPFQGCFNGVQQRTVPVIFQDSPAAFDGIVFAVIWRVVRQFQCQLVTVLEVDQPLHKLGTRSADLGTIVEIDEQPTHTGIGGFSVGPPQLQAVGDEVAGVARRAQDYVQLSAVHLKNAGWSKHCAGMPVMVGRTNRLVPPRLTPTRELANLHFGLGVERDAERFRVLRGSRVDVAQVVEDGVGGVDFFLGSVLRTRRSR